MTRVRTSEKHNIFDIANVNRSKEGENSLAYINQIYERANIFKTAKALYNIH